jgi:hypothetical protein
MVQALVIRGTVVGNTGPLPYFGVWEPTWCAHPGDIVTLTPDDVTRLTVLGFVQPV